MSTKRDDGVLYEVKVFDKEGRLKKVIPRKEVKRRYQIMYDVRADEYGPEELISKERQPSVAIALIHSHFAMTEYHVAVDGCHGSHFEREYRNYGFRPYTGIVPK